jgi:hypothetical protein
MLYVDNLQHGLNTNQFSLPRCASLDTKTIDEISMMDRRRDFCSGTIEFRNLRVRPSHARAHTPSFFLLPTLIPLFCFFIFKCPSVCVATAVQPKMQPCSYISYNFCVFLFFHLPNFSYLLKKIYWQPRSISDTCYSLPAVAAAAAAARTTALAPQVDHGRSAATNTSAHGAGISLDPGDHAAINCSRHLFITTPVLALPLVRALLM